MMLRGRMGVLPAGVIGGEPELLLAVDDEVSKPFVFDAVASAIADATGTLVSSRHPAGTHPCLDISVSTIPDPVGSR